MDAGELLLRSGVPDGGGSHRRSVPIGPVAGTTRGSLTTHDGQLRMFVNPPARPRMGPDGWGSLGIGSFKGKRSNRRARNEHTRI